MNIIWMDFTNISMQNDMIAARIFMSQKFMNYSIWRYENMHFKIYN